MKSILYVLIALTGFAGAAKADIFCHAPESSNQMAFHIKNIGSTSGSFYKQIIPVEVTVQALRLYYTTKAIMEKHLIQTRVVNGTGYDIKLGQNYTIQLEHIKYAPLGYSHLIGFTGVYFTDTNKKASKLKCRYI